MDNFETEPQIDLVDGQDVALYLTEELKDSFIRTLVTANDGGKFDEAYFQNYMVIFEGRIADGKVTLLLVDGQPAAVGAIDVVGVCADGRTLHEMLNLVVLPEFAGHGLASRLMEHRFKKVRKNFQNDPVMVETSIEKIAKKCLGLGMEKQDADVNVAIMKIRFPRASQSLLGDEAYEFLMRRWAENYKKDIYLFDPKK